MRLGPLAVAGLLLAQSLGAQTAPHQLVDVGNHKLDVVRQGTGTPVVVFEVGLGDSLDTFLPVATTIAKRTSTVLYSRAGFGRSEDVPSHTVPHSAADLHALLHSLQLGPPYVLVARSYGGLIARLFTSLYPGEVAGLVLVDATHEQQVQRWSKIDPKYPAQFFAYFDSLLRATPMSKANAAEIRETVSIQRVGRIPGMKPLPDIPLAVLTSMKSSESAPYVNGTARGHIVWRDLHDEWFKASRNAIHIETTHSGHAIQDDEPALVLQAIQFVLDRPELRQ